MPAEKRKREEEQVIMPPLKKPKTQLPKLSPDILSYAFTFLDPASLRNCMLTSKQYNDLAKSNPVWNPKKIEAENCLKELGYNISNKKDAHSAYLENLQRLTTILEGIFIEFKKSSSTAVSSISESKRNILKLLKIFNQPRLGKNNQNTMQEALYSVDLILNLAHMTEKQNRAIYWRTPHFFITTSSNLINTTFFNTDLNLLNILILCYAKEAYIKACKISDSSADSIGPVDHLTMIKFLLDEEARPYIQRFLDMCIYFFNANIGEEETIQEQIEMTIKSLFEWSNISIIFDMFLPYIETLIKLDLEPLEYIEENKEDLKALVNNDARFNLLMSKIESLQKKLDEDNKPDMTMSLTIG